MVLPWKSDCINVHWCKAATHRIPFMQLNIWTRSLMHIFFTFSVWMFQIYDNDGKWLVRDYFISMKNKQIHWLFTRMCHIRRQMRNKKWNSLYAPFLGKHSVSAGPKISSTNGKNAQTARNSSIQKFFSFFFILTLFRLHKRYYQKDSVQTVSLYLPTGKIK